MSAPKHSRRNKITWLDLHDATYKELKTTYKVTDRELENSVRTHLDGSNAKERRELYETVYGKRQ